MSEAKRDRREQRHSESGTVTRAVPFPSRTADGVVVRPTSSARRIGRFARALIVDDHDELRRSLVRVVRTWSTEVIEATSVAEGKRLLARAPDLLVTDVRLPDGSGREVAVAASRLQPRPVIVAMSGLASASEAFALAQCGVRGYLTKPFAQQELIEAIEELLSRPSSDESFTMQAGPRAHALALESSLERFAERYNVTEREMALVRLTIAGVPRSRCPDLLNVSENTCKTLARRLLQRCGARNLAEVPRLVLLRESDADSGEISIIKR